MGYGAVQKDQSSSDRKAAAAAPSVTDNSHASADPINETPAASDDGAALDVDGTVWGRVKLFYHDNIGLFFVFLAQIFASIVSCCQVPRFSHILFWLGYVSLIEAHLY